MYFTESLPLAGQSRAYVPEHSYNLMSLSVFALRFQSLNTSPFQKQRLEAEREDKKRNNILYSTSSTNTTLFHLPVTLQRLERSKHRWHAHSEGRQIRLCVGLNIYFSFSPSPKLSHASKALTKKDGFLLDLQQNELLVSSIILIKTDSLVIPVRDAWHQNYID